jgi:tetratricopeptide (TPR) repeat protein
MVNRPAARGKGSWLTPPQPGSKAYRRQLRASVAALGFSGSQIVEHVANELMCGCGVRPRAAWRMAAELSLDEAAARYNALAGDPRCGMRGSRIWDYEQWPRRGVRPTLNVLKTLARVYDTRWPQLVSLDDLARMPEADRAAYHEAVAPADNPAGIVEQSSAESLQLVNRIATTNVDEAMLESLAAEVRAISFAYLNASPYPLLLRTKRLRDRVSTLLDGRQRPTQTRELHVLNARCFALLAWMSEDLGNHAAASDHAWAAWVCAEYVDHDGARRWARSMQSRLAFWAGDFAESAQLAADGLRYESADNVGSFLALLAARGWAAAGRPKKAREVLHQWESGRYDALDQSEGDGLFNLQLDRQCYLAGNALLSLAEPDAALDHLGRSLACYEEMPEESRFYGAGVLGHIDSGRVYLRRGDLDGAIQAIEPIFDLDSSQRLRMLVLSLKGVREELAALRYKDNRAAARLDERIRQFCADAVAESLAVS